MPFDFSSLFGAKQETAGPKTLVIHTERCPQSHRCPAVRVCPTGALSQTGFAAPTVDEEACISCGKCSRYCAYKALAMESR
jgi:Fe-S-cluster-containing hydrogenase component 2